MKSTVALNTFMSVCVATCCAFAVLPAHVAAAQANDGERLCSPASEGPIEVEFVNKSSQTVSFHWMEMNCSEGGGPVVAPGKSEKGVTYPGHIYRARNEAKQVVNTFTASATNRAFVVEDSGAKPPAGAELYTESTCSKTISPAGLTVEFVNHLNEPIVAQWVDFDCKIKHFMDIPANGSKKLTSYEGHVFRFIDSKKVQLRSIDISPEEKVYHVSDD